jgi:hypothetical protein
MWLVKHGIEKCSWVVLIFISKIKISTKVDRTVVTNGGVKTCEE